MNNPQKQTIYLPVKQGQTTKTVICDTGEGFPVKQRKGYFFTPEQLNEYTANVIKQALETAAKTRRNGFYDSTKDEQSITDTFEETFKKFKV